MIQLEVAHVSDLNKLEAARVRPNIVVASLPEDSSLLDFGPSLQVPKPKARAEVADQVYDTILQKEVRHLLDSQDPRSVEVHIQAPKDNGVPEALQGILQVRQVLQRQRR